MGPKWLQIARLLRRNKVSVEERFHQVRQRLVHDVANLNPEVRSNSFPVKVEVTRRFMHFVPTENAMEKYIANVTSILADGIYRRQKASRGVLGGLVTTSFQLALVPEGASECCRRCGFFVPSEQTGLKICLETKWCDACSTTPAYFCGDILRMAHEMHKTHRVITNHRVAVEGPPAQL
jgi:hypothetical protein